jgi:hypothetical protein
VLVFAGKLHIEIPALRCPVRRFGLVIAEPAAGRRPGITKFQNCIAITVDTFASIWLFPTQPECSSPPVHAASPFLHNENVHGTPVAEGDHEGRLKDRPKLQGEDRSKDLSAKDIACCE